MRSAWYVGVACLVGQSVAYTKSALTAGRQVYCIALPFGECETILASGWSVILKGAGAEYNLPAAVATFVPLFMIYTFILSAHDPSFRKKNLQSRGLTPAAWLYLLALLAIVALTAMTVMEKV